MVSMARSILAGLARPAAVAPVPVSAEPHYSGSRDPCQLITATTLARYAPGTSVTPQPQTSGTPGSSSGSLQQCSWGSNNLLVLLTLWSYPNATGAAEDFSTDAQAMSRSTAQVKVTGSQWMSDVGERAVALFQTRPGTGQGVELFVWSGNAKIDLWLNYSGSATPGRIALVTASIAMARDILAALARPAASSQPHGPLYASPSDACALVKASTLAAYAPGAARAPGLGELQGAGGSQTFDCAWSADGGSIDLNLSIYTSADGAQGGFEFDLEQAHKQLDTAIHGTQPVKGLGEQATALFETQMGDSPGVQLYVWSGNAEIQVSFSNVPFSTPVSRAAMLAADTAITRDVLADLHRKAGSAG
jgi:hypothetical protein